MKNPTPHPRKDSGAVMLVAVIFVFACTIAMTAFMFLLSTRLRQSEANDDTVLRHIDWTNTSAVNLSYAHYQGMRDGTTQAAKTAQITTTSGTTTYYWGGVNASAWTSISPFRTSQKPLTAAYAFPYNNILPWNTTDRGVFFVRTDATSDNQQSEHLSLYNYLMTYPSPLLGDLCTFHKSASGASGTYSITDNLVVSGRVVIWDRAASTGSLRANSVMARYTSGTSAVTTLNNGGTASLLPDNFPAGPSATAGNTASASSAAVTDGTLNMCRNNDFPAGSLYHIATSGSYGAFTTWSSMGNAGTASNPAYTTQTNSPTYAAPSTSPYNYTPSGQMNTLWVNLANPALNNLVVSGNYEQIVLQGSTTAATYTTMDALPPVIIYVGENNIRDIRFVGENNRRIILALGRTTFNYVYMGFTGTSSVAGGTLRWRLHLVSENAATYLDPPTGTAPANTVTLTGSIRTNWSLQCTDATNTPRFYLNQETVPGLLENMLPRDSYFTTYTLVK
jgi:hypothetical protein